MDPEDVDYVCTLSAETSEKARVELNEDPKQRISSVQTLRSWIRQQSHYTCRTDTVFLLAVLRRAKFIQLTARQLIDNIMKMRTKCPECLANLDLFDPSVLAPIEHGTVIYLPKVDKEGRAITIMRPGKIPDLNNPLFSFVNEIRSSQAMIEMFRTMNESASVNGVIVIYDFTGLRSKYLTRLSVDELKKYSKIFQDCTPERVKAFLFYNAGPIVELLMSVVKRFMKKKNQDRIQVHDTLETMYKVIPMELWPEEYLPDDYTGPSAGSISDIAAHWKNHLKDPEMRRVVLENTSDRYKINEKKKSKEVTSKIPHMSFRKLSVN